MAPSDSDDGPPDGPFDEALQAARTLLRRLIQAQGFTLGEIDAKLHYARGYVSRLIHGQARLTYQHILSIMKSIELEPALFFSTLHPYSSQPPAELAAGLRELRTLFDRVLPPAGEASPLATPLAAVSDQDLDARIEAAVRTVRRNRISTKS